MSNNLYRPTKLSTKEFIERSKLIHGDKYDYSKVEYENSRTKVEIICPIHGSFFQKASDHIHNNTGCVKCGHDKKRKEPSVFLNKAKKIHNNKYNYSKVEYKSVNHEVIIGCPIHGYFKMTPRNHLRSYGCSKCGNAANRHNLWTYSGWEKSGNNSENFDSFKLYIIKCFNKNETFYKIGKTFTTISKRYSSSRDLPYMYEIIKVIYGSALKISQLEQELHNRYKEFSYTPVLEFKGMYECYNINIDINMDVRHNKQTEKIAKAKPKATSK